MTPCEGSCDHFGCKAASIGLSFKGGRKAFHGPTLGERRREAIADAKLAGNTPNELTRRERRDF